MADIDLSSDSLEWLEPIICRLLSVGIPPTAISNALDLAVEPIKALQDTMRINRYGTAELAEAMNFLIWKALDDTLDMMASAPIDKRMRLNTTLLARASAIVHGQQPDSMARIQKEMADLTAELTDTESGSSIYELGSVDAPTDDPKKGFES